MYGHVKKLADAEAKGIKEAGGSVDMYQLPETLPSDVLEKMHAPPKDSSIPTLEDPKTLEQYDGVLFGMPTRYGNFPAQWKIFWVSLISDPCNPPGICHRGEANFYSLDRTRLAINGRPALTGASTRVCSSALRRWAVGKRLQ